MSELQWSVVIPTYQRETILLRCLYWITQQTLLPKEIIVIDASPNWHDTYAQVMTGLAVQFTTIQWHYVPAHRASSAAQRNQGIALNTADIIFLIDDDSLMYPNCAEEVMQIYAADTQQQIAGIMPFLNPLPPEMINYTSAHSISVFKKYLLKFKTGLRYFAKSLIKDDNIFIPYDFSYPSYELPELLKQFDVYCVPMIHGARMSYRREILAKIHFEEILARYAVNEDNDVCYRASRLGMLLHAMHPQICHLQVSGGRLSRFTVTALWGLNQALLHRLHSPDLAHFQSLFIRLLRRRLFTQAVKDILDRRWTLPAMRGIWFVWQHYQEIITKTPEELRQWYPKFQQDLINRDKH